MTYFCGFVDEIGRECRIHGPHFGDSHWYGEGRVEPDELGEIVRNMVTAVQVGNEFAWRQVQVLGSEVEIVVRGARSHEPPMRPCSVACEQARARMGEVA